MDSSSSVMSLLPADVQPTRPRCTEGDKKNTSSEACLFFSLCLSLSSRSVCYFSADGLGLGTGRICCAGTHFHLPRKRNTAAGGRSAPVQHNYGPNRDDVPPRAGNFRIKANPNIDFHPTSPKAFPAAAPRRRRGAVLWGQTGCLSALHLPNALARQPSRESPPEMGNGGIQFVS